MKIKILFFAVLLASAAWAGAATNDLTSLLQQGLFDEEANHDLNSAIIDYQSLATQFDRDRQLAATAIYRLGECYRKLGQTNEAVVEYQRILKDFGDQADLVTLSRQDLTGLGAPATMDKAIQLQNSFQPLPDTKVVVANANQDSTSAAPADEEAQEIQHIQTMLQNSPDLINAPSDANGDTPLIVAAQHGWLKVAAFLLDHGVDVNLKVTEHRVGGGGGPRTMTALDTAAKAGNRAMVELLLNRGAEVNATNFPRKRTALHTAVAERFAAVTEVLLAHQADINAPDDNGYTPLSLALENYDPKIVQILLAAGANPNAKINDWGNPLTMAARLNLPAEAMKLLLAAGADPNVKDKEGRTSLGDAAENDAQATVKMLLAAGVDPNVVEDSGRTALSRAAEDASPEMVKLLLAAKANPNGGQQDAPLLAAIYKKNAASAELLLQAGANPNAYGRVGNAIASWARNHNPVTPLYFALAMNQLPLVQLLLKYHANPNDAQTDGRAVAFTALEYPEILAALLDAGGRTDVHNQTINRNGFREDWTLLTTAAEQRLDAAMAVLLPHGADPNQVNGQEDGPLYLAAKQLADVKMFELLLAAKADPNLRNRDGKTPLDLVKDAVKAGAGNWYQGYNLNSDQAALAQTLVDLLHQHGALDKLPDWEHIQVSRPAAGYSVPVFHHSANDWNQVTLLETIVTYYESSQMQPDANGNWRLVGGDTILPFPDLAGIVIVRSSHNSTNQTRIAVNLLNSTNGLDFTRDVPLEFGDVVEIPERDHALSDGPVGLTGDQRQFLEQYLKGTIQLEVRGQKTALPIYRINDHPTVDYVLNGQDARKLLLSSCDLSQVKVTRHDPKTGKNREWILACNPLPASDPMSAFRIFRGRSAGNYENPSLSPDLRLQDGDVVEVPEKP